MGPSHLREDGFLALPIGENCGGAKSVDGRGTVELNCGEGMES